MLTGTLREVGAPDRVSIGVEPTALRPRPRGFGLGWQLLAWAVGAVALFVGYLRMSRTLTVNADGAANAVQAREMLDGNVLLRGWTLSDVPFYTTELPSTWSSK
jgi:hypothetical protein